MLVRLRAYSPRAEREGEREGGEEAGARQLVDSQIREEESVVTHGRAEDQRGRRRWLRGRL